MPLSTLVDTDPNRWKLFADAVIVVTPTTPFVAGDITAVVNAVTAATGQSLISTSIDGAGNATAIVASLRTIDHYISLVAAAMSAANFPGVVTGSDRIRVTRAAQTAFTDAAVSSDEVLINSPLKLTDDVGLTERLELAVAAVLPTDSAGLTDSLEVAAEVVLDDDTGATDTLEFLP